MPPFLSIGPRAIADPRRAALVLVVALAAIAVLLYVWWPAGVALGLAFGAVAVLAIGRRLEEPVAPAVDGELVARLGVEPDAHETDAQETDEQAGEEGVRADLTRLRTEFGDDYRDFARAARLVVSTQYASAARLQRDLHVPYSRARRLLADLETEHFVGPATASLPRQVLLPRERLPEVERLFADA